MENNSKLRTKMLHGIWIHEKMKNDPKYDQRRKKHRAISKKIDLSFYRLTRQRDYEDYKFYYYIWDVYKALQKKIAFEKSEMKAIWDTYLFDETPANYDNDILPWVREIRSEIKETFDHLKREIDETVMQYYETGYKRLVFHGTIRSSYYRPDDIIVDEKSVILTSKATENIENDKVILIREGLQYKILKSSIRKELESLLDYIEWRQENSYAFVVCKTIMFAEKMKKMMGKKDFPYYQEIKTRQIPLQKAYVPLYDVKKTFTSKLVVEPAKYIPSRLRKCHWCNYRYLTDTGIMDHTDMYHYGTWSYHDTKSPFYWETPPRHVVERVEERRAIGIMFHDPEYMVLFECKTPRNILNMQQYAILTTGWKCNIHDNNNCECIPSGIDPLGHWGPSTLHFPQ